MSGCLSKVYSSSDHNRNMDSRRTLKKERFAYKFVECGNASEAYRFAYNARKMKPDSIKKEASKLLKDPYVTRTVHVLRERLMGKLEIDAEKVLQEFQRVAFADMRNYINQDNSIKPLHELGSAAAASIAYVEYSSFPEDQAAEAGTKIKKLRLHDKLRALDGLARHLGLFRSESGQASKLVIIKDLSGSER